MTVAELERRISTKEYSEWAAFYAAESKIQEQEQKKLDAKMKKPRRRR